MFGIRWPGASPETNADSDPVADRPRTDVPEPIAHLASGADPAPAASRARRGRPVLTARWLRDAMFAHRLAFEREMQRDRRRLERRFEAYLQETSTRGG